MPVTITRLVGEKHHSKDKDSDPNDVKKIQALLNKIQCGPREDAQVAITGTCDQDTIKAIRRFQGFFPDAVPDGRVDPGRTTLRRLNELAEPLKLHAITPKSIRDGGYKIAYSGEVPTPAYKVLLCISKAVQNSAVPLSMIEKNICSIDVSDKKKDDLIDSDNLEELLEVIRDLKLWGGRGPAYVSAVVLRANKFFSPNLTISRSNCRTMPCPVRPYTGELRPELGEQDDGPPLVYSGILDGRMLYPKPLKSSYFYIYADEFETKDAKRGLNCITYCGAVFGVDPKDPVGSMTGDGGHLADVLHATDCDMEKKKPEDIKKFFKDHERGTYIMWRPGSGAQGHVVLVVNGRVHEYNIHTNGYNTDTVAGWDYFGGENAEWSVRKLPKDFPSRPPSGGFPLATPGIA